MKKNNEDKKGKIIKGLMITGLATVLAIGGGAYIYNDMQVKKEAKLQEIAKAEEEKRLAEEESKAKAEEEKKADEEWAKNEIAKMRAEEEAKEKRIAEEKAKAETENTTESPTEKSTLNQDIQETTRISYVKNEENIPKVVKIEDPMTTTTIEQTTEATTGAPTTQKATEKPTQATTQTEKATETTTQVPIETEKIPNGTVKDGKTYLEGFGWVDGTGSGSVEKEVDMPPADDPSWNEIIGN